MGVGRANALLPLLLLVPFTLAARRGQLLDHWSLGLLGNHNPSFFPGRPLVYAVEDCDTWQDEWATRVTDGDGQDPNNFYDSLQQSLRFRVVAERPELFEIQPAMTDGRGPVCPIGGPHPLNPYIIPGRPACERGDLTATDNQPGPTSVLDKGGLSYLTFKCRKDMCGCTTVSVQLEDDGVTDCVVGGHGSLTAPTRIPFCPGGCNPPDCSKSLEHMFTICILCVNDCPSFQTTCSVKVQEDETNVEILNWAYAVNRGPANEVGQTVRFEVEVADTTLFKTLPYVVWDPAFPSVASLKFEPLPDAFGTARMCVTIFDDGGHENGGCEEGSKQCCTIEVTPVNDCPTWLPGRHDPQDLVVVVDEDSGRHRIERFASSISAGASNEAGQNLWFNIILVDPLNAVLFKEPLHIDPATGDLVFEMEKDVNTFGTTLTAYIQLQDDGGRAPPPSCDASCNPIDTCPMLRLVVNPVNDPPHFHPGPDIAVCEDLADIQGTSGRYCYPNWASGITPGADREGVIMGGEGQTVRFELQPDDVSLFATLPSIDPATGSLCFALQQNAWGSTSVMVRIVDSGPEPSNGPGMLPGSWGSNVGPVTAVRILVHPSNDPPTWTPAIPPGRCLEVAEGAGEVSIEDFAQGISRGAPNEASQRLTFDTTVSPENLFAVPPHLEITGGSQGRLTFTTSPGKSGTALVRVILQDSGGGVGSGAVQGTCAGGDTDFQTFCITVTPATRPPALTIPQRKVCVREDAPPGGEHRIPHFFRGLTACHRVDVTVGNSSHLFDVAPAGSSLLGELTFTTAPDAYGDAFVFATAVDTCQTPPVRSDPIGFTICIEACNDPPRATVAPDLVVEECTAKVCCEHVLPRWATAISPGPRNEAGQGYGFTVLSHPDGVFERPPSISRSGTLSFCLIPHRSTPRRVMPVLLKDDGGRGGGCEDTLLIPVTFEVTEVNQPPSFVAGPAVSVNEDAGCGPLERHARCEVFIVEGWATGISPGPNEEGPLTFTCTPGDLSIVRMCSVDAETGTLTMTIVQHAFGETFALVTLHDPTASSPVHQLPITVLPVNDPPSFTHAGDVTAWEDSCAALQWVTSSSRGPPNESPQQLSYLVSLAPAGGDPTLPSELFAQPPAIDPLGVLRFCPMPDAHGSVSMTVFVRDDGGVLRGGKDSSAKVTVTLTVSAVNDCPTVELSSAYDTRVALRATEDQGPLIFTHLIAKLSAGALDERAQKVQLVAQTEPPGAFLEAPYFTENTLGGEESQGLSMHAQLAPDFFGTIRITLRGRDNGHGTHPHCNTSTPLVLILSVGPVNDPPRFLPGPKMVTVEDAPSFVWPAWAQNITAGPPNEAEQTLRFEVNVSNPDLFESPPRVSVTTGDFMFTLRPHRHGFTAVTVCLRDNGGTPDADRTCAETTVTVNPRNDPPGFDLGEGVASLHITVDEDSGTYHRDEWIRKVLAGPAEERLLPLRWANVSVPPAERGLFTEVPQLVQTSPNAFGIRFTVSPNAFGGATALLSVFDAGAPQGMREVPFTITVRPVNDPPSFTPLVSEWVVVEDSGSQRKQVAVNITAGPGEDGVQAVRMVLEATTVEVHGRAALLQELVELVAASPDGALELVPARDAYGVAQLKLTAVDSEGLSSRAVDMQLVVLPVNDPPAFTLSIGEVVSVEDTLRNEVKGFATGITSGGEGEEQQSLVFGVEGDGEMFADPPSISRTGDLTFTSAANRNGRVTISVRLADTASPAERDPRFEAAAGRAGVNLTTLLAPRMSPAKTAVIRVLAVNDPPSIAVNGTWGLNVSSSPVRVLEDSGEHTFPYFITAASAGGEDENRTQHLAFTVQASNPLLFSSQPRVNIVTQGDRPQRELSFTLAPHRNGETFLMVHATDPQGGRSSVHRVGLVVTPVNDPPLFVGGSDVEAHEDTMGNRVAGWARDITSGPDDESSQRLAFTVLPIAGAGLFATLPSVDPATGDLGFELLPDAFGTASFNITLSDDGGTGNGGVDTSEVHILRFLIHEVNDLPSYVPGPLVVVPADAAPHQLLWAREVSPGPREEASQTVSFLVSVPNPRMFAVHGQPVINPTGLLSFAVAGDRVGNTTLLVALSDSAGLTTAPPRPLHITILPPTNLPYVDLLLASPPPSPSTLQEAVARAVGIPATAVTLEPLSADVMRVYFKSVPLISSAEARRRLLQNSVPGVDGVAGAPETPSPYLPVNPPVPPGTPFPSPSPTLEPWAVAAIVVAGVVVLAVLVGAAVCAVRRKEGRELPSETYSDPSTWSPPQSSRHAPPQPPNPIDSTFGH